MLSTKNQTLEGKTCLVSGSGNVAQYTVEKILDLGGKPVTMSDSNGYIYDEAGIDREKLAYIMELKNIRRGRIKEYAEKYKGVLYTPIDPVQEFNPLWDHKADCAFPICHPERDQREGCGKPHKERRLRRERRRQYAHHA